LYLYTRKGIKMESLSLFVKRKRKELKLTQEDLAFNAGVGLRFVRDLEQGKESLRLDKVNDVLALFGKEVGVIDQKRG
jgi:y4mF family transcriptional regulator